MLGVGVGCEVFGPSHGIACCELLGFGVLSILRLACGMLHNVSHIVSDVGGVRVGRCKPTSHGVGYWIPRTASTSHA